MSEKYKSKYFGTTGEINLEQVLDAIGDDELSEAENSYLLHYLEDAITNLLDGDHPLKAFDLIPVSKIRQDNYKNAVGVALELMRIGRYEPDITDKVTQAIKNVVKDENYPGNSVANVKRNYYEYKKHAQLSAKQILNKK